MADETKEVLPLSGSNLSNTDKSRKSRWSHFGENELSQEVNHAFYESDRGNLRTYKRLHYNNNDGYDTLFLDNQRKKYPWLVFTFRSQEADEKSRSAIWGERLTPFNISSRVKINVFLSFLISLTIVCLTTAALFYSGVGKTIVGFFGFLGTASPWGIPVAAAIVVLLVMIPTYFFLKHWFFKLKTFKDTKAILSLLFSAGIVFFIVAGLLSLGLGPVIVHFLGVSATIVAIAIAVLFVSLISYSNFLIDDTIDKQWHEKKHPFDRISLIISAFFVTSAFIIAFFLTTNLHPLVALFLHGVFESSTVIQAATLLLASTAFLTSIICLITNKFKFFWIDYSTERDALYEALDKTLPKNLKDIPDLNAAPDRQPKEKEGGSNNNLPHSSSQGSILGSTPIGTSTHLPDKENYGAENKEHGSSTEDPLDGQPQSQPQGSHRSSTSVNETKSRQGSSVGTPSVATVEDSNPIQLLNH